MIGKQKILMLSMCCFFVGLNCQAEAVTDNKPLRKELSNPNASPEARALFAKLQQVNAEGKTLSGQMWAPWGIDEIEYVYNTTGKYPAVRGHDLIHEASNAREMMLIIDWYHRGGIPTLMWHWGAPTKGEGYEQSKMTIDVAKCFEEGTAEHKDFWADLKRVADWLTILRDVNVPVLWRPMHEFDGKWFWYGKGGGENFVKIWTTMYDYFTKERKLNNLIWVLCHSDKIDASYVPGKEYFDIAGPDTYNKEIQETCFRTIESLHGKNTMMPLHECGTLPDPDECKKNGTMWLWWMLWHTSHATKHNKEDMIRIYNHPMVITLDEL